MFFGFFYFDWTIIILIPAMILAIVAQIKVNTTFDKYNKVRNFRSNYRRYRRYPRSPSPR